MSHGWIDGHCHLSDPRLENRIEQVVHESRLAGVDGWVQGGVSPEDWDRQERLSARIGGGRVLTSFGLHPWWVTRASGEELKEGMSQLLERLPRADAAGEMGLDYSERNRGEEKADVQAEAFRSQLRMAQDVRKPLVLHIVGAKAHTQALDILAEFAPFPKGGLVHSFSASQELAERYVALGFLLSISGAATKAGFQKLKKALDWLPAEHLVIETDSPDQPPAGVEGLNEPSRLLEVAQAVAELRNESTEAVLDRSAANLRKLFGRMS
ncbi:MAG TPA: TatD family hydrolase [Bdellovibrionota bacterium]|nr:TatD family hydrolase [Bdellovibrionota bacterium]